MQYLHPERPEELAARTRRLGSWGAPFVISLVVVLLTLAVYLVRPALRWLGLA